MFVLFHYDNYNFKLLCFCIVPRFKKSGLFYFFQSTRAYRMYRNSCFAFFTPASSSLLRLSVVPCSASSSCAAFHSLLAVFPLNVQAFLLASAKPNALDGIDHSFATWNLVSLPFLRLLKNFCHVEITLDVSKLLYCTCCR